VGLVEFVLVAAGCGGYVYRAGAACHVRNINQRVILSITIYYFSGYIFKLKTLPKC
jgi:hypothetical protein